MRSVMEVLVSLALLGAAIYVMLWGNRDGDAQRWAAATLGSIMTYWLTGRAQ